MEANYEDYTEKELLIEILRELKARRKQRAKPVAADLGLMSNEHFCSALRISRYKAAEIRKSGKLPSLQIGKIIYYRITDVHAFLEAGFRASAEKVPANRESVQFTNS